MKSRSGALRMRSGTFPRLELWPDFLFVGDGRVFIARILFWTKYRYTRFLSSSLIPAEVVKCRSLLLNPLNQVGLTF